MPKNMSNRRILTYFLVIILPICIVYLIFMIYMLMRTCYLESEKERYQLALDVNGLEEKLQNLENLASAVLQNNYVEDYLEKSYTSDWEIIYDYLANVQYQLHSFINYNAYVDGLVLYNDNISLNPGGFFRNLEEYPAQAHKFPAGSWRIEKDGTLCYDLGKYSTSWPELEYAAEIRSETLLGEWMEQYGREEYVTLYLEDSAGAIHRKIWGSFSELPGSWRFYRVEQEIPSLQLKVYLYLDILSWEFGSLFLVMLAGIFLFLLIFLLLLLYLSYSIRYAKRIEAFTNHIRMLPAEHYEPYPLDEGTDEVGELVSAFNTLALQTDTLVNIIQKKEILRKKAELDAYQSKIEPHFLYGTLDSLRMMAWKNGDREVAEGLLNLARLMRYSLTSSGDSTLEKELNQVRQYLELRKLRLGERLEWEINVKEEELLSRHCPQFLLQPLVENSVKHGIEPLRRGGRVEVNIWKEEEALLIEVTDDGAGISEERMEAINGMIASAADHNPLQNENEGYALYNICMRIRLHYGKGSMLSIERRKPSGTICRMKLVYDDGQL